MFELHKEQNKPLGILIDGIMDASFNNNMGRLDHLLEELKIKKNLEPKKTTQHTHRYLCDKKFNFQQTYSTLMKLMKGLTNMKGRDHLKKCIFLGFKQYMMDVDITDQEKKRAFENISEVDYSCLKEYIQTFSNEKIVCENQAEILRSANQLMLGNDVDLFKRALLILHCTNLQHIIKLQEIIDKLKAHVNQINFKQIQYYFSSNESWQQLGNKLSMMKTKQADKMALSIIERFKASPTIFPQLLINIERRGLKYNYRNNPLYVCEAKFMASKKYMAHIVSFLYEQHRLSEAKAIIDKYGLYNQPILRQVVETLKDHDIKTIKNRLIQYDKFGATELTVLGIAEVQFLQLIDFGIEQKDVIWVDNQSNTLDLAKQTLIKTQHIGFDVESSGGIHSLQGNIDQILQIASNSKIFIFDLQSLSRNLQFKKLIQILFFENNEQIIIGHACSGDIKSIHSIVKTNKKTKNIQDTQKLYTKKKLGALKDIVFEHFNRPLSKFQQCSGWDNRPLRKAQLHYAALDAFVLIKLYTGDNCLLQ